MSNLDAVSNTPDRIRITYLPVIDEALGIYDSDVLTIPVLDEDWERHAGAGVAAIVIEKGTTEHDAWRETLIREKCGEFIEGGRLRIDAIVKAPEPIASDRVEPEQKRSSPYEGTAFAVLSVHVSTLKDMSLIPSELRMDAIELLHSELEGIELLDRLKLWSRNQFLKPGVKSRLTTSIKRLASSLEQVK
jgi:hypothetical protein